MLSAVVEDFSRIPGVKVATLLHETCKASLGQTCRRSDAAREEEAFRELASQADFTLVIAPESEGILALRSRWVWEAGGKLLGSSPEAIEQTADKLALAEFLLHHGVPTPRSLNQSEICNLQSAIFPAVLKPRDGAGSQATFLVRTRAELECRFREGRQEYPDTEFIVQPFIPGIAASAAFLVRPGTAVSLKPCLQNLSADGRFQYLGGGLPLPPDPARRAVDLGSRAVRAVPGLQGFVGVDLVLGEADDGSDDQVIEINPRLTTSYIGLRRLARFNIAEVVLAVVSGNGVPELDWTQEAIRFQVGRSGVSVDPPAGTSCFPSRSIPRA